MLPGLASAATRPTTFWLYMGMSCVGGFSSDGAQVHVVWKGASGAVKVDNTYRAGRNGGSWEACGPARRVLRAGDTVKATVAGVTRKLVIPTLKVKMDTAMDTFYGRAPARSVISLAWETAAAPVEVRVRSDGRWRQSESGLDIVSGMHAYARWRSAKSDTVTFENIAP